MKAEALAGSLSKACKEQSKLLEINGPMYEEGNPVGVKYLLSNLGVCAPYVRLPLLSASKDLAKKIEATLQGMKNAGG
jgi:4-hydroxy-tetrahydrodipicolinate synthase